MQIYISGMPADIKGLSVRGGIAERGFQDWQDPVRLDPWQRGIRLLGSVLVLAQRLTKEDNWDLRRSYH